MGDAKGWHANSELGNGAAASRRGGRGLKRQQNRLIHNQIMPCDRKPVEMQLWQLGHDLQRPAAASLVKWL